MVIGALEQWEEGSSKEDENKSQNRAEEKGWRCRLGWWEKEQ